MYSHQVSGLLMLGERKDKTRQSDRISSSRGLCLVEVCQVYFVI